MRKLSRIERVTGGVAWQILVNAIFDFVWTTARKQMDLINGQRASVRETDRISPHVSVSRMPHAREYCGRVVRSPAEPGHGKDT